MRLKVQFEAELFAMRPAPAIVMVEPAASTSTVLSFGDLPFDTIHDFYGNRGHRLMLPGGIVNVRLEATVDASPSTPHSTSVLRPAAIPDSTFHIPDSSSDPDLLTIAPEILHFTLPSRYCPADEFVRLAEDTFGKSRPGPARVEDIAAWINTHLEYAYGASDVNTSARDTIVHRAGVCRDFAHLGITFCRALNIPARYVSCYCLDLKPQDLHAYFEAYIGDAWHAFDATVPNSRPALAPIAIGRDAADCAWWTSYGPCVTNSMRVEVAETLP